MAMSNQPLETFEQHRPLLFAIAYRMLGSAMDAEDIVQEAFLRYQRLPPETVESPRALLSTMTTRMCLNHLALARVQRETYVGPWLPEPLLTTDEATTAGPEASPVQRLVQLESISMAFLVLLEQLSPVERAVFLLREVFDYGYDEIANILEKTEPACRQIFSRAKKHIHAHRPRFTSTPEEHERLVSRFMQMVEAGDVAPLTQLLAEDAVVWTDGGGKVFAARQPVYGAAAVAKFVLATRQLMPATTLTVIRTPINGKPGILIRDQAGKVFLAIVVASDAGKIQRLYVIGNPDKLRHL